MRTLARIAKQALRFSRPYIQTMSDKFDVRHFESCLSTKCLGRPCLYLERVDSTIEVAGKQTNGTVVIAREQFKGRGQRDNIWVSPAGCAMHIVGLAVAYELSNMSPDKLGKDKIKLKWPNDIYYGDQKIGGILINSTDKEECFDIIMSFGLNVFNDKPTTCLRKILGPSHHLVMEQIIASILNQLDRLLFSFDSVSFHRIRSDYSERCMQMRQIVKDENHGLVKVMEVDNSGFLKGVRCEDQTECMVTLIIT